MTRAGGNQSEKASLIAGRNPVHEALTRRAEQVEKVYVQQGAGGAAIKQITSAATRSGITVQYVPKARMNQLVPGGSHQGVAAVAASVAYVTLEDLLSEIGATFDRIRVVNPMLLLLDRIQDPHNYGAILRSAAAVGVDGIVVPSGGMAPISVATVKASAGTAGEVPIARVRKLPDAIIQLKEVGFWVVGLEGGQEQTVWSTDWCRPIAIVVGSEGAGLAASVLKACDELASIPIQASVESLNASVAAALAMFVAAQQRLGKEA
ncbi:MAG: 23S rRNA (guanosine(2251)-2'-O)-methyltransferase RlmB [Rhodothermales bacterium]|nr:23S rRNA (guanosine(2251)-2'-O)-methyltransferase RlmB [Rhodothermales bacterium]